MAHRGQLVLYLSCSVNNTSYGDEVRTFFLFDSRIVYDGVVLNVPKITLDRAIIACCVDMEEIE